MKSKTRNRLLLALLLVSSIMLPTAASADPGNQYCVTPPFITAGVMPNLLLLIDNSASMYDLAYTDNTPYNFCANSPATTCTTPGSVCSGAAICKMTATTTSTSTTSPLACTANADCVSTTGTCPAGSTCTWVAGDTCNTGKGQCKKSTQTVTVSTTTPKACTTDADCTVSGDSCNNKCTSTTRPCYDDTYSNTGTYTGYFNPDRTYCYSTKSGLTTCAGSGTHDRFDGGAVMPATCTYGGSSSTTPYVCVDEDTTTHRVSRFVASGKFLNWLTMSKFDIEKSILTGGKYLDGNIVGESRGCSGRKFIKTLPALPAISFGIRGGGAAVKNTSQATQYGTTYIEIYKGDYNQDACSAALNDWQGVTDANMGPLQVDTKACIGGTGSIADELAAANQTIHDCFWYFNGHGLSNTQPIKNTCAQIYQTKSPSEIISSSAPDAICSNALSHGASINDGGIGNTTGYLGLCFTAGTWNNDCVLIENKDFCQAMGGAGAVTDPSSESVASQTVQNVPGFVMELGLASLTMMNDYTTIDSTNPVYTMGFPLNVNDPDGFPSWPPTGLIQKYKETIRFGAMTFQNNGSGSECGTLGTCSATSPAAYRGIACTSDAACSGGSCIYPIPCAKTCSVTTTRQCYKDADCPSGETCGSLDKTDGGKIISYVGEGKCSSTTTTSCYVDSDCASLTPSGQYCNPSIGDHTSGLLKAIDDIQATSWTPFAEAYYNAMGYLARSNAYTVSSTTAPTSRSDANFSSLPSPNLAASYVANRNPSQFRCQSNNLLLITDGMSTADKSSVVDSLAALYAPQVPYTIGGVTYTPTTTGYNSANNHGYDATNKCPSFSGSRSISTLAWAAKNRDIKTLSTTAPASTTVPDTASESITTYVVYSGPETSSQPGLCDPKTLMSNTATNGGTSLLEARTPATLHEKIDAAFSTVAAKAASGTAASILSNSEGSGANILQAVFYPKKVFEQSTFVHWIGEMQNLWYFVDPYIQNSTIREDTDRDLKLHLVSDNVVRFAFDNSQDKTMVQRYFDSDGDGVVTESDKVVGGTVDPDYISSIWRAGMKLWERDDSGASARTIYTGYNATADSTPTAFNASLAATASLWDSLQIPSTAQIPGITDTQREELATRLVNYIRGTDQNDDANPCLSGSIKLNADCAYRKREVTIGVCSNNSQKRCTTGTVTTDCGTGTPVPSCNNVTNEWKLGDIISSTPRVQSTVRLNSYNLPAPGGFGDKTYEDYINSDDYKDNGMVYVGANDGMLHAFNLGVLSVKGRGFEKASLSGTDLGKEMWGFIPKNSLPYLKYLTDAKYNHIYYVDGRTVLLDASIGDTNSGSCVRGTYWECSKPRNGSIRFVTSGNDLDATKNTWRTILITGMGLGGASRNNVATETCTEGATGSCVKTPVSDLGFSSYAALDVTDPVNPKFLWEFSHNELGYATSAPAIVRIGDKDKNGRWFAVFGNGPFGPIDSGTPHQFKAQSNQHLRFFVVDLRTGDHLATINGTNALGISEAFAGTMLGASIDADRRDTTRTGNYQDDAIYAGYVKKASGGTWTDGGVVRIMTKNDMNPANWVASKVIDGIGPVTTAIARTQDTKNKNLWLYFGTGRFYFRDSVGLDDNDSRRALFGLREPCYNTADVPGNALDGNCITTLAASSPVDQTSSISTLGASDVGWRINLDVAGTDIGAERVVTDTVALTNGTVFFTSFKPTMDICGYGGNSYLWGVKYDTGGQAAASALTGKALIQLSTGEFREVDLSSAFTDKLNRRMQAPMTGKPPSDAPPIVSSSQNRPVKKILHIQEH